MSDVAPSPVKGQQASKNQIILVAVLGVALLIVLVFFVLKPFDGDSGGSASVPVATTAPATTDGGTAVGTPAPAAPPAEATLPPAPGRGRNPFDAPR